MKSISISNDIIPVGVFKTQISKWLKSINETGQPLIITQNGRPAGVLVSPSEYDQLIQQKLFLDSMNRGLSDAKTGNVYGTNEVKEELQKRRSKRNSR